MPALRLRGRMIVIGCQQWKIPRFDEFAVSMPLHFFLNPLPYSFLANTLSLLNQFLLYLIIETSFSPHIFASNICQAPIVNVFWMVFLS